MKAKHLSFLLFLLPYQVIADCGYSGFNAFPAQREIHTNSIFMLEGIGFNQKIITQLNKEYPIYLQSDFEQVSLIIEEIFEGEYGLKQAILKPERRLTLGTNYYLKIDNLSENEERGLNRSWNNYSKKFERIFWKVNMGENCTIPIWKKGPQLVEKEYIAYGCGPAINAIFELKTTQKEETLIKTELWDLTTNQKTVYYLTTWESKLYVGHGMCEGAFYLKVDQPYKVRFDIINTYGQESGVMTNWIAFKGPCP